MLPEAVRRRLAGANAGDREGWFFTAAALTYVYEKAGALPEVSPIPNLVPVPDTEETVCPAPAQRLIAQLLDQKGRRADLLALLFRVVETKGWVLAHHQIVPLLQLGAQPAFKDLQPVLRAICGARGRWMQQFNPAWQYLTPKDPELLWVDGSNAERREYLKTVRQREPARAFALLQEAWQEESSGRERAELLKILRIRPQADEFEFASRVVDDLLQNKDRARPINQEIKALASGLLLKHPDSPLLREIAEGLRSYVTVQKSMLGVRRKIILQLPEKEDAFFNTTLMCDRLSFERVSTYPGAPEPVFWFTELLRQMHPSAWETVFQTAWPDILAQLGDLQHRYKKSELLPLQNLAQGLSWSRYQPGIKAFLDEYPVDASNYFMLDALNDSDLERYIQLKFPENLPGFCWDILQRDGWVWTETMSRHVLKCLTRGQPNGYHYQEFGKMLNLGVHFHLSILPEVRQLADKHTRDWQEQTLRTQFLQVLVQILETRKAITQL